MAVASNKPGDFSRQILAAKGIARYFVAIVGPGPAVPPKPDPEMLRRLMDEMQASAADTVAVGDMEIDAEFAGSADCRVVLVAGGSRSQEELARTAADAHLSRLAELPPWLERTTRGAFAARPRIGR
jgi:phosphoglycolate phosphatase-like HAD superfamily hydrolase